MRAMVRALVLAVMAAGCATVETTPSASVTTLMPDSERWFKLSWQAVPEKNGDQRRLRGYVVNTYGEAAARVQLLAQALDSSGAVVGQRVEWLPGVVPGFGRARSRPGASRQDDPAVAAALDKTARGVFPISA